MNPRALSLLVLFAVPFLLMPLPAAQAGEWSANVTPSIAINNGDNVNISINGWPTAFLIVYISLENDTVDTLSLVTGTDGRGSVEWSVPFSSDSGTYYVSVISGGENVTRTSFEVIYDRVTYTEFLLRQQQKQLDQQKGQLVIMGNYVTQVHEQIGWLVISTVIAGLCAIVVCIFYIKFYTNWAARELENRKGKKRGYDALFKSVLMVINGDYPPDGAKFLFHPGQQKSVALEIEAIRKAKGEVPDNAYVLMPDDTAAAGYRMYPVNDVSEKKETPVPTPEQGPIEGPGTQNEEADDMKTNFEEYLEQLEKVPPKPGLFDRIFHRRRNRKMAEKAARSRDDEDSGNARERPVPAVRNRNRVRRPLRAVEPQEVAEDEIEDITEEMEEAAEVEVPQLSLEQIRAQIRQEILREMLEKATAPAATVNEHVVPNAEPVPKRPATARKRTAQPTDRTEVTGK